MSTPQSPERTETTDPALVDFDGVPRRLRSMALALTALALMGCIVDGVLNGLTFALMGRWVGILVVALMLGAAVTTALHALGGADRAGKRGERLSSPDVGIAPRRMGPLLSEPLPGQAGDDEQPDG